jgi:hypothetical protein
MEIKPFQFQKFIDAHPPLAGVKKADIALLEKYKDHVPENLLELWKEYGFGFYGDGFLQLINPDVFHEVLCGWLMREPDFTRIPIMMTAFGTIVYYRMLARDEAGKIIADDVAYLEPNYSSTDTCAWSLDGFFEDYLCEEENIDGLFYRDYFQNAKDNYGDLEKNEMFFFVPALRLGGSEDIDNMDKGNANVHLNILLQLALGE